MVIPLIFFTSSSGADSKTSDRQIRSAQSCLEHAKTFYWLARARKGSLFELRESAYYAQEAKAALAQIKSADRDDTTRRLEKEADAELAYARAQARIANRSIANRLPLYKDLLGRMSLYESMDDPDQAAAGNAIKKLVDQFNGRITFILRQPLVVVMPDPSNRLNIEEIAYAYLSEHTVYDVMSPFELRAILSQEELSTLRKLKDDQNVPTGIYKKLAANRSTDVSFARLVDKDTVNGIHRWDAYFSWYDMYKSKWENPGFMVRGFSEDVSRRGIIAYLFVVSIFILSLLVPFLYRINAKDIGRQSFFLSGAGFFCGLILVIPAFRALRNISPQDTTYFYPSSLLWALTAGVIVSALPLIACYYACVRYYPDKAAVRRRATLASLAFGAMASGPALFGYHCLLRFGVPGTLVLTSSWLVVNFFAAHVIAVSFESYQKFYHSEATAIGTSGGNQLLQRPRLTIPQLGAALIVLILFSASVFFQDPSGAISLESFTSVLVAALALAVIALIHSVPEWVGCGETCGESTGNAIREVQEISLEWLSNAISKPQFIGEAENRVINRCTKFIAEISGIDTLVITARPGYGKSRLVDEIEGGVSECSVFRGRCRQASGLSPVISYEPFALALGRHIGIGTFEESEKKAERLSKSLPGLEKIIGSAIGIQAFLSLFNLRTQQSEKTTTSPREIVSAVTEFLKSRAEKAPVVFIIEDIEFMDEATSELFSSVFKRLLYEDRQLRVCFLITRSHGEYPATGVVRDIASELRKQTGNRVYEVTEEELKDEKIATQICEAFHFDQHSREELGDYFAGCSECRPLHIIEFIKTLQKQELIELDGREFRLKRGVDLKSVPMPDDLKGMAKKQISTLSESLISVLEAAALMGMSFQADYLAEVYGVERLKLLRLLREAEDKQIVYGEHDLGIFMFDSSQIRNCLQDGLLVPTSGSLKLTQLGKEYLARYVELLEKNLLVRYGSLEDAPAAEMADLAERANVIGTIFPGKSITFNRIAAEKSYRSGRYLQGRNFYEKGVRLCDRPDIDDGEKIRLLMSYTQSVLDSEADLELAPANIERIRQIRERSFSKIPVQDAELLLMESIAFYKLGRENSAYLRAASECSAKVLGLANAGPAQVLRAKFYIAASMERSRGESRKKAHDDLLRDIDQFLATGRVSQKEAIEVLQLKSETLNSIGSTLAVDLKRPELAIDYFEEAKALKCLPEINDVKGTAISLRGMGVCRSQLGENEKAVEHHRESLEISKACGDLLGMIISCRELGEIFRKSNDFEKAIGYFRQSYSYGRMSRNHIGMILSLADLIATFHQAGTKERDTDIAGGIERLASMQEQLEKAPDWVKQETLASLTQIQGWGYVEENRLGQLIRILQG